MAPGASSDNLSSDPAVPINEIVFSCGVCQATISEVYAKTEPNHGFHSGSGDDEGIVTRLWIADCSHVFCGKHLDGGAAPFHSKDTPPRAPCPVCVRKGDTTAKGLYGIRGLSPGEYDNIIPETYTQCPPHTLDVADPNLDALRFQYSHLAKYAQAVRTSRLAAQQKCRTLDSSLSKEQKRRQKVEGELQQVKERIAVLEKAEAKLGKWEERKPMINHYLGIVDGMAKDIDQMRSQLASLGYEAPKRNYAFGGDAPLKPEVQSRSQQRLLNSTSSATMIGETLPESPSSKKRKRPTYATNPDRGADHVGLARRDSIHRMPPPLVRTDPARPIPSSLTRLEAPLQRRVPLPPRQNERAYLDSEWDGDHFAAAGHRADVPAQDEFIDDSRGTGRSGTLSYRPAQSASRAQGAPLLVSDPRNQYPVLSSAAQRPTNTGFLATPLRRTQQAQLAQSYSNANGIMQAPLTSQSRIPESPRIPHYESGCGTVVQQSGSRAPRQMQGFDETLPQRRDLVYSRDGARQLPFATPSAQRSSQLPVTSVASPFFRHGSTAPRPDTVQYTPSRRAPAHQQLAPPTRDGFSGYRLESSQPTYSYTNPATQAPATSLYSQQYPSRQQDTRYPPPSARMSSVAPQQEPAFLSQTPHMSQGYPMHAASSQRMPAPAMSQPFRAPSQAPRTRISLPSARTPGRPLAGNDDSILARIPGVRGVSNSRFQQGSQTPAYGPNRSLYSAAGSRRSVVR